MSNSSSSVTVVIPAYNAQEWIKYALESVFAHPYPYPFMEVIIVDDGSVDDTRSVSFNLLKQRETPFQIKEVINNAGPSHARNIGWQSSQSEWIQFLDADDLLHPEKIVLQSKCAVQADSKVAVIYSPWQRIAMVSDIWQPVFEVVSPVIGQDALVDLLKSKNFLQLGSTLIRRSWLERVGGFDERYRLIEDVHLLLRIAMAEGQFRKVDSPVPLFYYRQLPGASLSQRDQRAFIEGCLRNAALVEDYWRSQGDLTSAQTETLIDVYFQGARFFATADQARFAQLIAKLESFRAPFIPTGPVYLRLLSRFTGYRQAEWIAARYRHLKQVLQGRTR
jgi:glycosyltransferase involved in cell wall biosynthesis